MHNKISETKTLHGDAFQWKADHVPFGIWVVDKAKQQSISTDDPLFIQKMYERQLTIVQDTMRIPSDLIPTLGVTSYGCALVPSLLGAKLTASSVDADRIEDLGYWIKPIENLPDVLHSLEKKEYHSSFFDQVLQQIEYYKRNKPENIWLSSSNVGPLTVAELIRGSDFYMDLVDDPPFVHELLRLCTDAVIDSLKTMRRVAGYPETVEGGFPSCFGIYAPGIRLGDDTIFNLSEDMIREYVIPCYERIAQSLHSPLVIHFCSVHKPEGRQIIRALADCDAVAAVSTQLGYELYDEFEDQIRGKLAIECGYGQGIAYGIQKYGSFRKFAEHIKSKKNPGMIMYTTVFSSEEANQLWNEWSSI